MSVECTLAYIIYEAWIPAPSIEDGHKHILFLRFKGGPPECIITFKTWGEVSASNWVYGLSSSRSSIERE